MAEAYEVPSPCSKCHRELPRYGGHGGGVFPDKEVWSRYICLERVVEDRHHRCPVCGLCNDSKHIEGADRADLSQDFTRV